jgi:hypothetical protein
MVESKIEGSVVRPEGKRKVPPIRLYKKSYSSFEQYTKTRWGWSRSSEYKYIQAAEYVEALGNEKTSTQFSSVNQALKARKPAADFYKGV